MNMLSKGPGLVPTIKTSCLIVRGHRIHGTDTVKMNWVVTKRTITSGSIRTGQLARVSTVNNRTWVIRIDHVYWAFGPVSRPMEQSLEPVIAVVDRKRKD